MVYKYLKLLTDFTSSFNVRQLSGLILISFIIFRVVIIIHLKCTLTTSLTQIIINLPSTDPRLTTLIVGNPYLLFMRSKPTSLHLITFLEKAGPVTCNLRVSG